MTASTEKSFDRIGAAACLTVLLLAGCGDGNSQGAEATTPGAVGSVPAMPMPVVGKASLAGHVRGADGHGIAAAIVEVAETGARAVTDPAGSYQMTVDADSTITLSATAPGLASTFRESVMAASGANATDFDLLLLSPAEVGAINALVGVGQGQENARGLMALRLHGTDPDCAPEGAVVTVWPPLAATVIYSRPGTDRGLDQPDPSLTAVQPGTRIQGWLAGAVAPGIGMSIDVQRPGCLVSGQTASENGIMFSGRRHVVAQSLTQVDVFVGGTP